MANGGNPGAKTYLMFYFSVDDYSFLSLSSSSFDPPNKFPKRPVAIPKPS
jgi:hypothetical protein